jgi:DNA-3-methyladenine glycosylase II
MEQPRIAATTAADAIQIAEIGELRPTAPFDFAAALDYLRASPSAVLERIGEDDHSYRKALRLAGRDLLLTVHSTGTVASPRLALSLAGGDLDAATATAARALVTRVFALETDPAPFLALAARDPVFGGLIMRHPGLRPVLIADPFEALIWAVLGQQITITFARTLKLRLVALAGRTLTIDGTDYPLFPDPATLAALDPDSLRAHHFSRHKASYVVSLAAAVRDGALDFARIRALPPGEAIAALTRFHGIGRWTAEYLLMRGLGDRDSIPAADVGLRAIIGRWYGLGRKASEAEVRAYADAWAGWRGWAAFHWWHALQRRESPDMEPTP